MGPWELENKWVDLEQIKTMIYRRAIRCILRVRETTGTELMHLNVPRFVE